nr:MAG TPA: hypothetical protein [Bacteriophage sp.]
MSVVNYPQNSQQCWIVDNRRIYGEDKWLNMNFDHCQIAVRLTLLAVH